MKMPRGTSRKLKANEVLKDVLIPIFDTLDKNEEGEMESRSDREIDSWSSEILKISKILLSGESMSIFNKSFVRFWAFFLV